MNPIGTCHSQDSVSFFFFFVFFFFFFFFFFQYQVTPLHRAADNNKIEAVAALISHGADVNARKVDVDGWTPLMLASSWGNAKVVEALLDAGADKELKGTSGYSKGKPHLTLLGIITSVASWQSSSAARCSLQSFDHLNIIFIGPCAMCKPYEMISRAIQIVSPPLLDV